MYPMTDKFFDTIASNHSVAAKAELLVDGNAVYDFVDGGFVADGTVQVANEPTQRTGSLTLFDATNAWSPTQVDDLLVPSGNEIRLWRGAVFPDGTGSELAPIGTFRITGSKAVYPQIELDLYDRSWVVQGAKLETALSIASGTSYITAIMQILTTAYGPDLDMNFPDTDQTTPAMVFEAEADPWEISQKLAANLGMRLFFDQMGVATMQPEPDASSDVVWTFDDADVRNLGLPGLGLNWDANDVVNAVVVTGENFVGGVSRGVAYNTDARSPFQYGGRFGKRPVFIREEKILLDQIARLRAKYELLRQRGITQSVIVPSLVNSAFECGDTVRVKNAVQDIDMTVVLDRFPIPLRASGTMQFERTRKVPEVTVA
jgi:Domain of unknown function (DUF5047)